ncbi:HTH-type transcriptional regulator [Paenibacillus mucilaginosus 3016]|uniref:HTH-type transcriptional regulator n=1 Tax=Paenibacillus mucilaginosus 3016 TaxID=1116391 RepID=H6NMT9_9BACL|nr:AraC family transcriptional regulator [Paenibacillus mucilaginosus]AFC30426.1 HTH-type transcriptional regulator [Paenibacillus mucilaginosus 3016]WFA19064.1 AraC family transcriptional regulator [Paenibacillus mucilaginosus]
MTAPAADGDRGGEREPARSGSSKPVRLPAGIRYAGLCWLAYASGRAVRLHWVLLLAAALLGGGCAVLFAGSGTAHVAASAPAADEAAGAVEAVAKQMESGILRELAGSRALQEFWTAEPGNPGDIAEFNLSRDLNGLLSAYPALDSIHVYRSRDGRVLTPKHAVNWDEVPGRDALAEELTRDPKGGWLPVRTEEAAFGNGAAQAPVLSLTLRSPLPAGKEGVVILRASAGELLQAAGLPDPADHPGNPRLTIRDSRGVEIYPYPSGGPAVVHKTERLNSSSDVMHESTYLGWTFTSAHSGDNPAGFPLLQQASAWGAFSILVFLFIWLTAWKLNAGGGSMVMQPGAGRIRGRSLDAASDHADAKGDSGGTAPSAGESLGKRQASSPGEAGSDEEERQKRKDPRGEIGMPGVPPGETAVYPAAVGPEPACPDKGSQEHGRLPGASQAEFRYGPEDRQGHPVLTSYHYLYKGTSRMNEIRNYMEQHYADSDFSLTRLSELLGLKPKYASQLFKETFGVTFLEYTAGLRVEEAKRRLRQTDETVHEIALAVGYLTPISFGRMFKRCTGITPGEYRRACRMDGKSAGADPIIISTECQNGDILPL